jgi:hypothetical protein
MFNFSAYRLSRKTCTYLVRISETAHGANPEGFAATKLTS